MGNERLLAHDGEGTIGSLPATRQAVIRLLAVVRALAGADVAWVAWGSDHLRPDAAFDAADATAADAAATWSRMLTPPRFAALLRERAGEVRAGEAGTALEELLRIRDFSLALLVKLGGGPGDLRGVFLLARRRGDSFGALGHTLSSELAPILLELLRTGAAEAELLHQRNRAATLVEMLGSLDSCVSPEAVASTAAPLLRRFFAADRCVISRVRGDVREVIGIDTTFPEDDAWLGAREPALDFDWLGLAGDPGYHVVSDLRDEPRKNAPRYLRVALTAGVRSVLRVRLGPREAPVGIISLASKRPNAFGDADGEQLERLGRPLALVLRLAEARERAERSAMRAEAASRLVARVALASTREGLVSELLANLRGLFGAAYSELVWAPAGCESPFFASSCEWMATEDLRELLAGRDLGPYDRCRIANARHEQSGHPLHQLFVLQGMRSCIQVPLVVEGFNAGRISVWHPAVEHFGDDDLRRLDSISPAAALALARIDLDAARSYSEAKYRAAIAQAQQLIFLFEPDTGRITEANEFAARTLGYDPDELVGRAIPELCTTPPDVLADNVREVLETGVFSASERKYVRKDGSVITVDIVASRLDVPGGRTLVIVFGRDVSDRLALQRQLIQAQKMESLGQMAGMVAHDFNNILTTILGFSSMLKRSPRLSRDEQESVQLIEEAARRAADLSGRLLAFSRGGLVRFGPVDLCDTVRATLRLAEPALQQLKVELTLPPQPMVVEGDEGQLQQAILNILLNARDAMPEGGTVRIEAYAEGGTAFLTIADDGPGMDEETRTRIFEPFFTTKPPGQGTGLGMAIVYGIVQAHHGTIAVESAPGAGATFLISLPLAQPLALPAPRTPGSLDGDLVLVVDDDDLVRRTTGTSLAQLGYTAVEASNGRTAIELVRARPERFRAVLLDLVMPGLTGADTFRGIRAVRPDLPVIICTGYAAEAHLDDELRRSAVAVVQKPFTPERLRLALERAGVCPAARRS